MTHKAPKIRCFWEPFFFETVTRSDKPGRLRINFRDESLVCYGGADVTGILLAGR